ncbi:LysR substrate-binding domain-containing protein [Nonomuraea sp. NPDC049152]|uniref:LysR substrate-binding domain-containing protein n=1 Tax=Nonomuraea sp. NPDC049152 TaxID=3154350 RepID=UPI0033D9A820
MDQRDIETFLTLAEELHFGRTAERLRLSQGSVSQIIKKLERRVGAPLFERSSRHVALTGIGRRLRDDIEPAHRLIKEGVARATSAGRGIGGVLTLGFVGAAMGDLLVEVGERFKAGHADCEVRFREIQVIEGLEPLRAGEIDMMAAPFPLDEPDLTMGGPLLREARMLAVPASHLLARRSSVSIEDLARLPVLTMPSSWPATFIESRTPSTTPGGKPIARGPEIRTLQEALALTAAGKGVFPVGAQVMRYYVRPGVAYIPFHDAPPLEWGLVWRTADETNRIRSFANVARTRVTDRTS